MLTKAVGFVKIGAAGRKSDADSVGVAPGDALRLRGTGGRKPL